MHPSPRIEHALALALSACCALLLLSACGPGTLLGNWQHPDVLANHWVMRWVAGQILTGGSLTHNSLYYWPVGDDPLTNGNAMEAFGYLPFAALLPWPGSITAWAFCVLTANGVAAYALSRAVGTGAGPGWVAAVVVGTHPYLAGELTAGHFPQANLVWLLLALRALRRLLDGRGGVLSTGVLVALCGLSYWYHAVFFGIGATFMVLEQLVSGPGRLPRARLVGAALLALVLVLPWLWWSLRAEVPGLGETFPHPEALEAALRWDTPVGATGPYQQGRVAALMLLPLATLGLRGSWSWALLGLAAWWLGTAGAAYEALYGLAEPLRRFWWPYRHGALLVIAWAVLGARGLERLRPRPALSLALALSLPLQLWLVGDLHRVKGSPMTPLGDPAPAPGVVLEPPLFPGGSVAQGVLYDQIWLGLPTVTGHALWVDRVRPDAWDRVVVGSAFLGSLQRWERGGPTTISTADLDSLREQGLRYLVLNPGNFARELEGQLRGYRALGEALGGAPIWAERGVEIYEIRISPPAVELPPVRWPRGLRPAGPTRALQATPLPHPVFGQVLGG